MSASATASRDRVPYRRGTRDAVALTASGTRWDAVRLQWRSRTQRNREQRETTPPKGTPHDRDHHLTALAGLK